MSAGMLELTHLEAMLEDECGCQMKHKVTECSVAVTHRIIACDRTALACLNGATNRLEAIRRNRPCIVCEKPASDCWRVVPV